MTEPTNTPDTDKADEKTPEISNAGTNQADRLAALKERATTMGISFHPNIGADKLSEKINAALDGKPDPDAAAEVAARPAVQELSPVQKQIQLRNKIRRKGLRLRRVRITNHNPLKRDIPGEIFTVANRYLGDVKRYIPYGEQTENGYHVEECILRQLETRKYNSIKTKIGTNGRIKVNQRWVKEFSIEYLDELTKPEIDKLARVQLAKQGVEEDD